MSKLSIILTILVLINSSKAWDTEELEIFDLVEEIKDNFYTILGVNQDATLQEIKRAFRNLSVILHPDKNDAEDANEVFRNLVFVYDVLKDSSKREKYDKVLKEGLPNWKSALYYYRKVKKVGFMEASLILFVVITIGQYFIAWAAYLEKKYTAEQLLGNKIKKLQKRSKTNVDMDQILAEIPTPSIKNTLPFQIPMFLYWTVTGAPLAVKTAFEMYAEQKKIIEEQKKKEQEELELQKKLEEDRIREKEERGLRRRNKKNTFQEKTDEELARYTTSIIKNDAKEQENSKPIISGGLWTEEDLVELVRLVKKYPGGTTNRWELIAEQMSRTVSEVTYMAHKMKETGYKIPTQQPESVAETIALEAKKVKTKKTESVVTEATSNWSQTQQQALETAIQKYPKSGTADRWTKIANSVPGKTKEECMARYKHLVELVKKQKEKENEQEKDKDKDKENEKEKENESKDEEKEKEESSNVQEMPNEEVKSKGKARNKRKERKKNIDYYSVEDNSDENYSDQ